MTAQQIIETWIQSAAACDQWDSLEEDEKIEFAFNLGKEEGILVAIKSHAEVSESLS